MADTVPILWPDDIDVGVLSPLIILRAQVEPLKQRTHGLIEARIKTQSSDDIDEIIDMDLESGSLGLWYNVLRLTHKKDRAYPVTVIAACFEDSRYDEGWPKADSPEEFTDLLRTVLRSRHVKAAINSILSKLNEQGNANAGVE